MVVASRAAAADIAAATAADIVAGAGFRTDRTPVGGAPLGRARVTTPVGADGAGSIMGAAAARGRATAAPAATATAAAATTTAVVRDRTWQRRRGRAGVPMTHDQGRQPAGGGRTQRRDGGSNAMESRGAQGSREGRGERGPLRTAHHTQMALVDTRAAAARNGGAPPTTAGPVSWLATGLAAARRPKTKNGLGAARAAGGYRSWAVRRGRQQRRR